MKKFIECNLVRWATFTNKDWWAIFLIKVLKLFFNKSYHHCTEWDYLVICDGDYEFKFCDCKLNNMIKNPNNLVIGEKVKSLEYDVTGTLTELNGDHEAVIHEEGLADIYADSQQCVKVV
jgi:hypothetical protein